MKSLGKQTLIDRSLLDGALVQERTKKQVVYTKADGTYWVNYLDGKREVKKQPDGSFLLVINARSINSLDGCAFLDLMVGRMTGGIV